MKKTAMALVFGAGIAAGSLISHTGAPQALVTPGAQLSPCMRTAVEQRIGAGRVDAVNCSMGPGARDGKRVDLVLCKATREGREIDLGALSDTETACMRNGGIR